MLGSNNKYNNNEYNNNEYNNNKYNNNEYNNNKHDCKGLNLTLDVDFGILKDVRQDNNTLKYIVERNNSYAEGSVTYDGDLEKGVMKLILQALGITDTDILVTMGNVKTRWLPSPGDTFFFMNNDLEVDFDVYTDGPFDRAYIDSGNYFKSRDQASAKVEKVRKMFNEDYDK